MKCIGKPFQCQQRYRSCYEVSYPNAAIARFSAFIKQQDYHVFFSLIIALHIMCVVTFCDFKFGVLVVLPGEIYESQQSTFSHLLYRT